MRVSHVAVAVPDARAAAEQYRRVLGAGEPEFEDVESEGVRVAILRMDNCRIELMEPLGESSPVRRFLDKRGPGLHHVAFETDDVDAEAERAGAAGARLVGGVRPGSAGTRVAFIHPGSLSGVLAELCSPPRGATP